MTRSPRAVTAVLSLIVLPVVIAGCDGSASDDPENASKATVIDGKYCGLVSQDLIHEVTGPQVETSDEQRLASGTSAAGVTTCMISSTASNSYVRVLIDPVLDGARPADEGECENVTIAGWGSVSSCWNGEFATVRASPPEKGRFLRVDVRVDEPGAQAGSPGERARTQATEAAVRIAEQLNTNFNAR